MKRNLLLVVLFAWSILSPALAHAQLEEVLKRAAGEIINNALENRFKNKEQKTEENSNNTSTPVYENSGNVNQNRQFVSKVQDGQLRAEQDGTKDGYRQSDFKNVGWDPANYSSVPSAAKTSIFNDQFEDNNSRWILKSTPVEKSNISNGYFNISATASAAISRSIPVNLNEKSNYEIEAEFTFMQGRETDAIYLNWGKYMTGAYGFGFSGDGHAYLFDKFTPQSLFVDRIPWTQTKLLKGPNQANKLTVRKVNSTYFFFINEKLVNTAPVEPFFGNYIGFVCPQQSSLKVNYITVSELRTINIREMIQAAVSEKVKLWQEKGKFEKTADYELRVTAETRKLEIDRQTQIVINKMGSDRIDYKSATNAYDSDNEAYKIMFPNLEPIFLKVPIAEAENFDKNFKNLTYSNPNFTLSKDDQFVLLHLDIINPGNGKKYQYDSQNAVAFNSTELNFNFDPIDVNIADNSGGNNSGNNGGNTGGSTKKKPTGKSDVDINIPVVKQNRENTYVLVIGNEDYSSFQTGLETEVNVDYAANDAKVFKDYMVKTFGVPEKNVILKINATLGQMKQAISKLSSIIEVSNGAAEVIVYYSGHGLPDEKTKDPYIMPVDISGSDVQSAIKVDDMYNQLTQFPHKRVTVFLDACFSGGARGQALVAMKGVKIKPKSSYLTGSLVVFASSSGEESSNVYRDKQHGLYTYFLLKKLQETKGMLSYQEMADYLTKKVALESVVSLNKKQTPQTSSSPVIQDQWGAWKF